MFSRGVQTGRAAFFLLVSMKIVSVKCPCALRLCKLATVTNYTKCHARIRESTFFLTFLCKILQNVFGEMSMRVCASICVLPCARMCSHMCARMCVCAFIWSHMCALVRVPSYVRSHVCALLCVLLLALTCVLS